MKRVPLVAFLFSLSLPVVACSSDSGVGAGSGGQSATGGSTAGTGGGGATDSGGNGSGGVSASGGASNNGGAGSDGTASSGAGGNTSASGGGGGQSADGGTGAATGGVGGRGGGAGMGGGGDGGATTFNPCPPAGMECKIMPLGDSITLGSHSSGGGYRVELFRESLMGSQKVTFVGRASNGPDTVMVNGTATNFPKGHEGYSGDTIDTNQATNNNGISATADAALTAGKPHIVLLMIGTNDVNKGIDLANAPTRLGKLLDQITTMAPNALLVVAKITPTKSDSSNTKVQSYNNAIPGLVQARASGGKHIIMVDMYAALTADASYKSVWLDDSLHPNDAGYVVMSQTWYAGIKSYLR